MFDEGPTALHDKLSAMLGLDPPSNVIDATEELWSFFADHPRPW